MPEETHKKQFKGVWIPKSIWEHPDLTWLQKCLLAEIDCLEDDEKGCTASNEYLAAKFGSSPASIANTLTKLRSLKLVETMDFDGRRRAMRVNQAVKAGLTAWLRQPQPKVGGRVNQNGEPIVESTEESKEEEEPAMPREASRWNDICGAISRVLCVPDSRLRHLKARRGDPFWAANFEAALGKVAKSAFCRGQNDRGWKASFDWLLQPDALAKVMEGKYDDRKPVEPPKPKPKYPGNGYSNL